MRVAAILGLGSSAGDLKPFQIEAGITCSIGLPSDADEVDAVLVFGGDGTVHRHLAPLVKLGLPVLVVPCGSGNDFARALELRRVRDSLSAWRHFLAGGKNTSIIDLGRITPVSNADARLPPAVGRYFCCVGGVGLDAEIARRANNLPRWLRGHGGYALSLPGTLARFAPFPMRILLAHHHDAFVERHSGPAVLAAFANAPAYGGGMRIAPNAQMDDGRLDVCLITDINKFKLFCLFPTVYFGGHLGISQVDYFQADRLRLETESPLDVYADGEYVCRTPVEVSVAPRALTVIVAS